MYLANFRFLEFLFKKKEAFHLGTITLKSSTMLAPLTSVMAVSGSLLLCLQVISPSQTRGLMKLVALNVTQRGCCLSPRQGCSCFHSAHTTPQIWPSGGIYFKWNFNMEIKIQHNYALREHSHRIFQCCSSEGSLRRKNDLLHLPVVPTRYTDHLT